MIKEKLFGATKIPLLTKGLDAFALRHRAISDNVANSETPGYKRRHVEFESKLMNAIGRGGLVKTCSRHLGSGGTRALNLEPELKRDNARSDVNDQNNVDIDFEMGEMAKNHLKYSFASKMTKLYFEGLKTSIIGY